MDQVPHRVRSGYVLAAYLAEVIRADLEFAEAWNVALVAYLDTTLLSDLVHVQSQVSKILQGMRDHEAFEAIVADSVDSQVQDFKVREARVGGDELRSFLVDVV